MKLFRSIAAVILAAVLIAGAAGCTTPTDGGEAPAEDGTLTLHALQYELENQTVDFENQWFYKELEAKTGVHIEWEVVKDADWNQRMNLMFVSGEYPDIIIRPNDYLNVEEYGVTQGILVPLDDYLEENMPNYYSRLGMNNVKDSLVSSDGKMYTIGNLTAQNINHDGSFYINKMWLDALGMEIPETLDELTEVLIAFRDEIPGLLGIENVLPMSAADLIHQTQGVYTHFAMFGVPLQRWVYAAITGDQTVVFPGEMEGFRAACEWLNMCYQENLLDKESITQDSNAWLAKMNAGQVGFTTYLRLINAALDQEIQDQFVSILPPASEYGVSVPRVMEIPTYGAALTIANEHIEETLQWLDAQMETETMMVSVNGPIQEGGPIEPTMKINDAGKYEILYVPENNGLYDIVPVYHGQFFAPGDYYFDIYEMPPHRVERFESSKMYEEAGVLEPYGYEFLQKLTRPLLSSDEQIEQARIFDTLHTMMQETISNFITGGVTDENFQQFLDNAKSAGVEEYIATYQRAYDALIGK
ncbi:MAG: extracellular solute-binding protein [Clostridiales bacterium]|jgi:putative aldouronate transport system substrate-binding protein|nr:extracellular solute-binding protein [Clostridiales bacterium]